MRLLLRAVAALFLLKDEAEQALAVGGELAEEHDLLIFARGDGALRLVPRQTEQLVSRGAQQEREPAQLGDVRLTLSRLVAAVGALGDAQRVGNLLLRQTDALSGPLQVFTEAHWPTLLCIQNMSIIIHDMFNHII